MQCGSVRAGFCAYLFILFLASCSSGDSGDGAPATNNPNVGKIPTPSGISVSEKNQALLIKWSQVAEASTYELYIDSQFAINQSSPDYQAFIGVQQTQQLVSGLQNDKIYFFILRSVSSNGEYSKFTPVAQATPKIVPPQIPQGFKAAYNSPTTVELSWTTDPEATGYKLSRVESASTTTWQVDLTADTGSYSDSIKAATKYTYQLVASNSAGDSAAATLAYVPPATTPSGFSATTISDTTVDLSWSQGDTITDHYQLSRSENGAAYELLNDNVVKSSATSTTVSYRDNAVLGGKSYTYQIVAVNSGGMSDPLSGSYSSPQKPLAPTGFNAQLAVGPVINLSWSAVDAVTTQLVLSRSIANANNYAVIDSSSAPNLHSAYSDVSLQPGSAYDYQLQAFNGVVASTPVVVNVPAIPGVPAPPSGFNASYVSATSVNLRWTADAAATLGYKLIRTVSGGASVWQTTIAAGSSSYNDTSISASTIYDYQLVAVSESGDSSAATLTYLPNPAPPTALSGVQKDNTTVTLSWTAGDSLADGYVLLRQDNVPNGAFATINNNIANTATSIDDGPLLDNHAYVYELYAFNASGASTSVLLNYTTPVKPLAPANFAITLSNGPIAQASWGAADAVTDSLVLSRSAAGAGAFSAINTTYSPSLGSGYNDASIVAGNSYDYQLQALSGVMVSDPVLVNVVVPGIPLAPSNLTESNVVADSALLSWNDNSSDEDLFIIERAQQNGPNNSYAAFSQVTTQAANSVAYTDSSVSGYQTGGHYKYRVGAKNVSGTAYSNETILVAPPQDSNLFLAFGNKSAPRFQEDHIKAQAYYDAIDPLAAKTTFAKWKAANGFAAANLPAVYLNDADLGFARRMYVNPEVPGSQPGIYNVASYVENYATLADAQSGDPTKIIAVVAMEYTEPANAPVKDVVLSQPPFYEVSKDYSAELIFNPGNYVFMIDNEIYVGDNTPKYKFSADQVIANPDGTTTLINIINDPNGAWTRKSFNFRNTGVAYYGINYGANQYAFTVPENSGGWRIRFRLQTDLRATIRFARVFKVVDTASATAAGGAVGFTQKTLAPGDYALVVGTQESILTTPNPAVTADIAVGTIASGVVKISGGSNNFAENSGNARYRFTVPTTATTPIDISVTPTATNSSLFTPVVYLLDGATTATGSAEVLDVATLRYSNLNTNYLASYVDSPFAAGNYKTVVTTDAYDVAYGFDLQIMDTSTTTAVPCNPFINNVLKAAGPNPFLAGNPSCSFSLATNSPLYITANDPLGAYEPVVNVLGNPGDYRYVVAYGESVVASVNPRVTMTKVLDAGSYTVVPVTRGGQAVSTFQLSATDGTTTLLNQTSGWNPSAGLNLYAHESPRFTFNVASNATKVDINLVIPPAASGGDPSIEPALYLLDSLGNVIAMDDNQRHQTATVEADLLKGDYLIAVAPWDPIVRSKVNIQITDMDTNTTTQFPDPLSGTEAVVSDLDVSNPYSPNAPKFVYHQPKMGHIRLVMDSDYDATVYILGKGDRKIVTFYTYIGQVGFNGLTNNGTQAPPTPFYPANLAVGDRVLAANLDGRGDKYQPGVCNVCHGGAPKSLVGGVYPDQGDTNAGFLAWDMDLFKYAAVGSGYDRASIEPTIKEFNRAVLSVQRDPTYNVPGYTASQTARNQLIYGWYGGATLPSAFNGNFVPPNWVPDSQSGIARGVPDGADQLYLQVVKPTCRLCHLQRGSLTLRSYSEYEAPITFKGYNDFMAFKDDIEALVNDRGRMPAAKRTFDHFWSRGQADILAQHLGSPVDANGNAMQPGLAIAASPYPATLPAQITANADLKRYMATGTTINLDGSNSVFANTYNWTVTASPTNAATDYVLNGATTATPSFTANVDGDYTLSLTVSNAKGNSAPAQLVVNAAPASVYTPVSFATQLVPVFDPVLRDYVYPDNPARLHPFERCVRCHSLREEDKIYYGPAARSHSVLYGQGTYLWSLSGTRQEVYDNLLDRVNLHDPLESRLMNSGSRSHHKPANEQGWGFDDLNNDWQHFNLLLRWINEGAVNTN